MKIIPDLEFKKIQPDDAYKVVEWKWRLAYWKNSVMNEALKTSHDVFGGNAGKINANDSLMIKVTKVRRKSTWENGRRRICRIDRSLFL